MKQPRYRDQRKPGHFWADNELFDIFGPRIGAHGLVVYIALARRCHGYQAKVSLRELAAMTGISKDSVMRAMEKLEAEGLVIQQAAGPKAAADYSLVDVKELAQSVSTRDRYVSPSVANRDRFVRENCLTERQTVSQSDRLQQISTNPPSVSPGDSLDAGVDGEFETDLSHQKDASVSPSDRVRNNKQNYKTKSPIPSLPTGKGEEIQAFIAKKLLHQLPRLTPAKGDAADLHGQVEQFFIAKGYTAEREVMVPERGDGHAGRIDLVLRRGDFAIAMELDRVQPRSNSLTKLAAFPADLRVVVLRTGPHPASLPSGLDWIVAMNWPDIPQVEEQNNAAEAEHANSRAGALPALPAGGRADAAPGEPAAERGGLRELAGSGPGEPVSRGATRAQEAGTGDAADPRAERVALIRKLEERVRAVEPEQPAPESPRDAFDRLKLRLKQDLLSTPAGVARRFPPLGESQYGETQPYDACFRDWWLVSIETDDQGAVMWITEAARPAVTQAGLMQFQKRISTHLRELCDRQPQIVVRRQEEAA